MLDERPGGRNRVTLRPVHVAPLLIGVMIAARASRVIGDNSFLWHIRAGAVQLADGRVLTEDPFSFTAFGEPWRTQSWLLELAYGWAESTWSSLAWANWLVFGAGVVTFLLIGVAAYARSSSPLMVGATSLIGVWLFAPFAQPRPVVVSYVLLALVAVALLRPDRLAWTLPVIFWVFAAVHGSWVLGGALVLLTAIQTRDPRLVKAGAVSLGATALTSHGFGTWTVVIDFLRNQDALDLIQEWFPPDLGDLAQAPYLLVVVGIILGVARGAIKRGDLIVVIPFLLYGLTSQRAIFPAAIVLLPYVALALPAPPPSPQAARSNALIGGAMVAITLLTLLPMFARDLGVLDASRFPDDEIVLAVGGRTTFHDTAVGGYLIYRQGPDSRVYIDDRAELFGFERLDAARRANLGTYEEVFSAYGIDAAIVKPDAVLLKRLLDADWDLVAESESFVAIIRP